MPNINSLPSTNQAIFKQPLPQVPKKEVENLEPSLDMKKKKSMIILAISLVLLLAYSIFFFYGNVASYLSASGEIESMQASIQRYDQVVIPQLEVEKGTHKSAYDQEFNDAITALNTVFPDVVDKRGMIQLLESFSTEVALVAPPFEFTAINLEKPIEEGQYTVIPVSTTIHSSQAGFERFLTLVDRSGRIYEAGDVENKVFLDKFIRLMSISNISLKYRGVDEVTGRDGGVDFSVKLNFYSRNVEG